MKINKFYI